MLLTVNSKERSGSEIHKTIIEMATTRLKEKYTKEVVSHLHEKFQYKSVMQVPHLDKIVINKGIGAGIFFKIEIASFIASGVVS